VLSPLSCLSYTFQPPWALDSKVVRLPGGEYFFFFLDLDPAVFFFLLSVNTLIVHTVNLNQKKALCLRVVGYREEVFFHRVTVRCAGFF